MLPHFDPADAMNVSSGSPYVFLWILKEQLMLGWEGVGVREDQERT